MKLLKQIELRLVVLWVITAGLCALEYWAEKPYYAAEPPAELHIGPNDTGYSPALASFPPVRRTNTTTNYANGGEL